jgi:hypothetical protein
MKFKFSALVLAALVSTVGLTGCDFVMDQISSQPKPETTGKGKGKGKSQKDTQSSVSAFPKIEQAADADEDREPTINEILAVFTSISEKAKLTEIPSFTDEEIQKKLITLMKKICINARDPEKAKKLYDAINAKTLKLDFVNFATTTQFCPGPVYFTVIQNEKGVFDVQYDSKKPLGVTLPPGPKFVLDENSQGSTEGSVEKPETPKTQIPKESSLGEKPQTEDEKPRGDSAFQGNMKNASPDLFYAAYKKLANDNGYEPLFTEQQAFSQAIVVCESTKAETLANSVHGFKKKLGNISGQNQIIVGFIGLAVPTFCPDQKQAAITQLKGVFEDKVDGLY